METQEPASFQLDNFRINKFSFSGIPETHNKLSLNFEPQGLYSKAAKKFELKLFLQVFVDEPTNVYVEAELVAYYSFINVSNEDQIPDFFYKNAIAIAFPYLRSFISSLTLQANIRHVLLPIMNLSNLERPLREGTIIED